MRATIAPEGARPSSPRARLLAGDAAALLVLSFALLAVAAALETAVSADLRGALAL